MMLNNCLSLVNSVVLYIPNIFFFLLPGIVPGERTWFCWDCARLSGQGNNDSGSATCMFFWWFLCLCVLGIEGDVFLAYVARIFIFLQRNALIYGICLTLEK